jgi:hypothetical protein
MRVAFKSGTAKKDLWKKIKLILKEAILCQSWNIISGRDTDVQAAGQDPQRLQESCKSWDYIQTHKERFTFCVLKNSIFSFVRLNQLTK